MDQNTTEPNENDVTLDAEQEEPIAESVIVQPVYVRKKYTLRRSPIFLLIMLILVGSLAANAFILWNKSPAELMAKFTLQKPTPTPTPSATPAPTSTPRPTPTPESAKAKIAIPASGSATLYKVTLKQKDREVTPTQTNYFLSNELKVFFGMPVLTNDPPRYEGEKVLLAYDIRTTFPFDREVSNPKYNSTYYFLVQNYTLPLKTYPNDEFNVTVQSADQSLIPYVKDPEYCVQDSDCTLRTNFCTYGGFNNYHSFADTWGCEAALDEDGEQYGMKDTERNCTTTVTYTSATCVSNTCVAQGKQKLCN